MAEGWISYELDGDIALTGRVLSADEALAQNLVQYSVAAGEALAKARELAGLIAANTPELRAYASAHGMVISNSPERMIRAVAAVTRYGRTIARNLLKGHAALGAIGE